MSENLHKYRVTFYQPSFHFFRPRSLIVWAASSYHAMEEIRRTEPGIGRIVSAKLVKPKNKIS